MERCLRREFASLVGNRFSSCTYVATYKPPLPRILYFWLLPAPDMHTGHIHTCKLNTHTIKIKYIFLIKKSLKQIVYKKFASRSDINM